MNHSSPTGKPLTLLLVEDNPADVAMTKMTLEKIELPHNLHVARDGEQALEFLKRRASYSAAPRPDLTLLDLNLPGKDGREVLAEIKSDEALKDIPVVVLTTSDTDRDIVQSYRLHANSYVTKPMGIDQWLSAFQSIRDFWFQTAKLPDHRLR